jgi:L-alanine-DL-glutamate epimerase-like enolase superfamily enzyme
MFGLTERGSRSRKYVRQITSTPLEVVDSALVIGAAPGLGVEVDEEAVAAMDLRASEAVPA